MPALHFILRILTRPRFVGLVRSATSMLRIPAAISRMVRTVPTLMAFALFALASPPSQGAMLGSFTLPINTGIANSFNTFSITLTVCAGMDEMCPNFGPNTLFQSLALTMANAGQTFTATAANDPAFNPDVALLTNGIDESVGISMGIGTGPGSGGGGIGSLESHFFCRCSG